MELTLREIVSAKPSLESLDEQKPKDIKLGYSIAKNLDLIQRELRAFNKMRRELVMKHGTENEDGSIEIKPGKATIAFEDDYEVLLDRETDDIAIRKFTLQQLNEAGVELKIKDLRLLAFMIDAEEL